MGEPQRPHQAVLTTMSCVLGFMLISKLGTVAFKLGLPLEDSKPSIVPEDNLLSLSAVRWPSESDCRGPENQEGRPPTALPVLAPLGPAAAAAARVAAAARHLPAMHLCGPLLWLCLDLECSRRQVLPLLLATPPAQLSWASRKTPSSNLPAVL